jgi:DNA-binding transcriptional LysR family regulator
LANGQKFKRQTLTSPKGDRTPPLADVAENQIAFTSACNCETLAVMTVRTKGAELAFSSQLPVALAPAVDFGEISLRSLQVFVAVEETGSMTVAAERLNTSRSAVSQQITNLEHLVGASLFDRTARPMTLTPNGKVLKRHAHHILEAVGAARIELMELNMSALVELRIGMIDDLDASMTPELVGHIQKLYPRCQLVVSSGRSDALLANLVDRSIDIITTGLLPQDMASYQDFPIFRESFIIVAPRGVLKSQADLKSQLLHAPFVRYHPAMPMAQLINQHLRRLRIDLPAPCSFDASRSVFAMMLQSAGWTMTTPLCLLDAASDVSAFECFKLPFAGLSRTIRLLARREEFGRLPQQLAEACRRLIANHTLPHAHALTPWTKEGFVVLGDDGEAINLAS